MLECWQGAEGLSLTLCLTNELWILRLILTENRGVVTCHYEWEDEKERQWQAFFVYLHMCDERVLNMFIFLSEFTLTSLYVYFTFKVFGVTDLFHSLQNLQILAKYCKHPNKLIADIVLPKSYSKHLNYFSS